MFFTNLRKIRSFSFMGVFRFFSVLSLWILTLSFVFPVRVPAEEVTCDIVVVGGGAAGISAALFAGTANAKTILVEASHQIGGNTTSGGVAFPGIFHAWGRQVIAGPAWELIVENVRLNGGEMPDFTQKVGKSHWKHQIKINPALHVLLAEEALTKNGVEIRCHEAPTRLERLPSGEWLMETSAMGEQRGIRCRQIIDCTGSGTVCAMAGAKRMREKEVQPGTFNYLLHVEEIPAPEQRVTWNDRLKEAVKNGELQPEDIRGSVLSLFQEERSSSFNYVFDADNSTAAKRTETNLKGRAAALRVLRFVRTLPGLETARVEWLCPEVGVRETWRVVGEHIISADEYTSGTVWEDSLAYAFYPVDLHISATGVRPRQLEEGIVPTIPLRALIPAGVENMLTAGRCLSSDRLANSGLRVQGACMAGGQAAAAAAVIAVQENTTPGKVTISKVKALLKEHGCIVP